MVAKRYDLNGNEQKTTNAVATANNNSKQNAANKNEQSHGNRRLRGTLQYLTRTNGISNSESVWVNGASVAYQYRQQSTLTQMLANGKAKPGQKKKHFIPPTPVKMLCSYSLYLKFVASHFHIWKHASECMQYSMRYSINKRQNEYETCEQKHTKNTMNRNGNGRK